MQQLWIAVSVVAELVPVAGARYFTAWNLLEQAAKGSATGLANFAFAEYYSVRREMHSNANLPLCY